MNTLTLLLAQTKSAAIIEIILLLLVAVIIGYITSWLYYKSVYTKKIEIIESEMEGLKKQIADLEEDKLSLEKRISEMEAEQSDD